MRFLTSSVNVGSASQKTKKGDPIPQPRSLDVATLREAVKRPSAAAFRCATEVQPAGGEGEKVFPPTYEGGKYAIESRASRGLFKAPLKLSYRHSFRVVAPYFRVDHDPAPLKRWRAGHCRVVAPVDLARRVRKIAEGVLETHPTPRGRDS